MINTTVAHATAKALVLKDVIKPYAVRKELLKCPGDQKVLVIMDVFTGQKTTGVIITKKVITSWLSRRNIINHSISQSTSMQKLFETKIHRMVLVTAYLAKGGTHRRSTYYLNFSFFLPNYFLPIFNYIMGSTFYAFFSLFANSYYVLFSYLPV